MIMKLIKNISSFSTIAHIKKQTPLYVLVGTQYIGKNNISSKNVILKIYCNIN